MLSRSGADQAGAAKEAPRSRVYRWSSGRQPKTRPSAASLCYEKWSVRSPKFAADNRHIASGSVSPIHKRSGSRIEDTQNHPASGWRPSTFDKPLRWRSATEIRARFWETSGEPPDYTTPWGLLKQPDKHESASRRVESNRGRVVLRCGQLCDVPRAVRRGAAACGGGLGVWQRLPGLCGGRDRIRLSFAAKRFGKNLLLMSPDHIGLLPDRRRALEVKVLTESGTQVWDHGRSHLHALSRIEPLYRAKRQSLAPEKIRLGSA